MIRSAGDLTGRDIDFGGMAAHSHHVCRQYMIDPPAEIPLEGIAEVVPVGVLNDIRLRPAKDVNETPANGHLIGVSCVDVTKAFLTCVPEPPVEAKAHSIALARDRYARLIRTAGSGMAGESRSAMQNLVGEGDE